jgi:hypothetical protein
MEIYPGTSGRTQGERKEISPAMKAARIETSMWPLSSATASERLFLVRESELPVRHHTSARVRI